MHGTPSTPQVKVCKPLEKVIAADVDTYTSYCVANMDAIDQELKDNEDGFNVSKWWATHHAKYPNLAVVVNNIMCIPTTSANSERAFSTPTDVMTGKRNKLKGNTTAMLTFLKHNKGLIPEYTKILKSQMQSQNNNNASLSQDNE